MNLLLVEDNLDDVMLFQIALKRTRIRARLNVVHDGEAAIEYLTGQNRFSDRGRYPFPDAVILDIKMPRKSGLELLEWIRTDEMCRDLRVLILSSSSIQSDQAEAARLGVVGYFVKPVESQQLSAMIKDWFGTLEKCQLA